MRTLCLLVACGAFACNPTPADTATGNPNHATSTTTQTTPQTAAQSAAQTATESQTTTQHLAQDAAAPTPTRDTSALKPPAPDAALQSMTEVPKDFSFVLMRAFHSGNRAMMEGPSYTLRVDASGRMVVKAYGNEHKKRLESTALVDTLHRLGDLGFFTYPDQPLDDPSCTQMHTIDEDITLEVRADGRHRRIVYNRRCFTPATARIVQFANAVQVGWVKSEWIDPKLEHPDIVELD